MLRSKKVLEKVVYPSIERQAATSLAKKISVDKKKDEKKTSAEQKRIAKEYKSRIVLDEQVREVQELFHSREIDLHTLRVILCQSGGAVLISLATGLDYRRVYDWKRSNSPESSLSQFKRAVEAYTKNFRLAGKEKP